jgi:signal transduction histidine kinase
MLARNAKRLVRLTSDILEVSRIESNSVKLKKEKVDLKEKIQKVIEDTQSFVEEGKNLKLVFEDATKDPVTVYADKPRLFEVISNLLRNAIKFTDEGIIRIRLEASRNGFAKVSIIDNGKGIEPDIFPKLFTKFVSKSDSGTGLGLYISKNIVEAHDGKIWADNNPEGRGAVFTFTIPILITEEQKRPVEND